MNPLDNFLRGVESRYPTVYALLNGDQARDELEAQSREMERMKRILSSQRTRVIANVTPTRIVRKEVIGGKKVNGVYLEAVPVLIVK